MRASGKAQPSHPQVTADLGIFQLTAEKVQRAFGNDQPACEDRWLPSEGVQPAREDRQLIADKVQPASEDRRLAFGEVQLTSPRGQPAAEVRQLTSEQVQLAFGIFQPAPQDRQLAFGKVQLASHKLQPASVDHQLAFGTVQLTSHSVQPASEVRQLAIGKWRSAEASSIKASASFIGLRAPFKEWGIRRMRSRSGTHPCRMVRARAFLECWSAGLPRGVENKPFVRVGAGPHRVSQVLTRGLSGCT